MEIPALAKIEQNFPRPRIGDLPRAIREELSRSGVRAGRGARIAVAVGSRGLADLVPIVGTVVAWLREAGAEPFIVPAMGSHGGATAAGQEVVLAGYGLTAETAGAPIRSSMEVIELPAGGLPNRIFMDKLAYEADGTIVINRVKPHTDFHGPHESGLLKMCAIGLGKREGAEEIHRHGVRGLKELIVPTARRIIELGRVILGVAVVENAYNETACVRAVPPARFEAEESGLLELARANMPRLPTDRLDVLLVDEIGKDISGSGLDTNVIGRLRIAGEPEPSSPSITRIVVRDLTEAAHGNALGMGLADIITRRLFDKIDFKATYANALTTAFLERAKIPLVAADDREAVEYALRTCGPIAPREARIARIRETLHLNEVYVSRPVWEEIAGRPGVRRIGEFTDLLAGKDWLDF